MATYVIFGYAASALVYNVNTGAFDLRPDFDPARDRIKVTISDDDAMLDSDDVDPSDNEIGSDGNQTAVVTTPDGTVIASGLIYSDMFAEISKPDGSSAYLDRLEIGGAHLGYFTDTLLVPGESYPVANSGETGPGAETSYASFQSVPCYCAGTMIETQNGLMPVDWIAAGDQALTRDHGYQPVLWTGRTKVALPDLQGAPHLWPVTLRAGALGPDRPSHDLKVSADHRILVTGAQVQLLFGVDEVLVPAKALVNGTTITCACPDTDTTFFHVLFARHEILLAEDLWAESFFSGQEALKRVDQDSARKINDCLAGRADQMVTARMCPTVREAALLRPPRPHRKAAVTKQFA